MANQSKKFDAELLQAKWILGSIRSEDLPRHATLALQEGLGGSAWQQIAGLECPTQRDLDVLPERAFAEIGLAPINKEQAVSVVIARGLPRTSAPLSALMQSFPDFSRRWRQHVAEWGGEPAGDYNDMRVFMEFVIDDLYEPGKLDEVRRVFEQIELLLVDADLETQNLIQVGFLEKLRGRTYSRPYGSKVFEQFLGTLCMQRWQDIRR